MILEVATSLLAVAAFGLAIWRGRIVTVSRDALKATTAGLSAMTSSELDDAAKEIAVRRAGFGLIIASLNIFWRFSIALLAAAVPILLADAVGLVPREAVFGLMLRWDYIVVVSAIAIVVAELARRRFSPAETIVPEVNRYSAADRFFHMLAFSSPAVLKAASAIEDKVLSWPTQNPTARPIFITSLARGGTTALLNAFHDMPGVATHIYRDMPFLTAPNLWNRLAGGQKRGVERQQRAHGDGLEIDLETPEAFEEVVWKMHWPEKFHETSIGLWDASDHKPAAERFLKHHMKKIIRARLSRAGADGTGIARYCSKNNANIARIPFLMETFPGCKIVVPVRRPECHAASLLRQHLNFLKLQAEDEFVRRYMRDIGHFEFGQIHKPIQFPGFQPDGYDATTSDYWLHYWVQAFREIQKHSADCVFVLQDDLRARPQETMMDICNGLDIDPGPRRFDGYFRSGPDQAPSDLFDQELYREATEIYRQIEASGAAAGTGQARRRSRGAFEPLLSYSDLNGTGMAPKGYSDETPV